MHNQEQGLSHLRFPNSVSNRGQLGSIYIYSLLFIYFFKIYLFMIDIEREREAETQEEGEAGSMPGARRGTQSWDSRITPWAKGRR